MNNLGWTLTAVVTSIVSAPLHAREDTVPSAMQKARQARSEAVLRTGQIEFIVTDWRDGDPRTRVMTWRFGGPDFILVDRGDENGVVLRDQAGGPTAADYNTPRGFLVRDGLVWTHHEHSPQARVAPISESLMYAELLDPRQFGLTPYRDAVTLEERVARAGDTIRWESRPEGELERVTANLKNSAIVWLIDPKRNWNPVQQQTIMGGRVVADSKIEYANVDGVWFPRRMESCAIDEQQQRRLLEKFDLVYVAINRPEQPARLTPADIGVEVGTNIDDFTGSKPVTLLWDGERGVPSADFHRRVRSGELHPGPNILREAARLAVLNERRGDFVAYQRMMAERGRPIEVTPRSLGKWERYTLQFIDDHSLDDGQRERAMSILKDLMNEGTSYINRKKTEFDAFDQRLEQALKSPGQPGSEMKALREERGRLVAPLNSIFEERLKPRLLELLTSEQQSNADASQPRTASRPSGAQ